MIQFSKLRLHGFKSFVEKTELEIGPGLTGIVGPNGCGKSNLVEALRWSMGENSSKRMRGGSGSMDDVIFNGTERRPARNMAEVSLLLDNSSHSAPAPYSAIEEIEVVRKIERDHGSSYRINGKSARARDVQLLYADILSGANSPYLVSQGKVTTLINAKPSERRMILEEAAGITGLYARRHEAELRLRATDNNLKRLEDLLGSMESRLQGLKKQARQATKYRNLSTDIRQLEIMISSLEWRMAHEDLRTIEKLFGVAESAVAERMLTVSQLTKTQTVQSQDMPDLRKAEAEMSAALQARKLALQRLEDEAARLESALTEAREQLEQVERDRTHEESSLQENSAILEKLEQEEKTLLSTSATENEDLQAREAAKTALQDQVKTQEEQHTILMEKFAADRARKQGLEAQIAQDTRRHDNLQDRLQTVTAQLAEKRAAQDKEDKTPALRAEIEALEKKSETLREELKTLEETLEKVREAREAGRRLLQEKQSDRSRLASEIKTLESIVNSFSEEGFKPILEDVQADEGFELALSRALGDALMGSTEDDAPVIWQMRSRLTVADLPSLPGGAQVLTPHVKTPDVLKLALSQIGVVETIADGNKLAPDLKPGQALVARDGAYWRWDGLYIRETASDRLALQLQHKNRLADLQKQWPDADEAVTAQEAVKDKAETLYTETQAKLTALQAESRTTDQSLRDQRIALNREIEAQSGRQAELAKLEEARSLAEIDLQAVTATRAENEDALAAFDDANLVKQQEEIEAARAALSQVREELHGAIRDYEVRKQESSRRQARLQAIGDERINLQNRCIRSRERLKELAERGTQLTERVEDLKNRPQDIKKDSEELLSRIVAQEQEKSVVSDKLAALEAELADTNKALKEAEALLSESREARAHAQATAAERQRQMDGIRTYIEEHFGMTPEELGAQAAIDDDNRPDLDDLKRQKEKAVRERDLIGPVNLRADQEAEELDKELTTILNEKADLAQAISELRQGIQTLNKEARERLQAAFESVNAHFRDMFTRLFNGGKAHLALIESDDPLNAGLEIFAQPPGKTLQSLSLLSGGEQTLTAVALIFAMFLTNPAPICVLDEVDAPLDDANVDRFCDMLDEFADRGETRFLVITHHRLTMARMDRLYGVTMSERGVSQLVSVDMNQQLDFLEAAE